MLPGRSPQRSIVITGFHGCGARDIAAVLARRLRRPLVEWEQELQRKSRWDQRLVTALAAASPAPDGIDARQRLAAELPYRHNSVIVLAPEALLDPSWPTAYLENTFSVFVDPPFEALWRRISGDPALGALRERLSRDGLEEEYAALLPRLRQAALIVTASPNPMRQARVILHAFYT